MKPRNIMILSVLLLLVACAQPTTEDELRAGVVLYLTGNDYANIAQEFLRGLEIAKEDVHVPLRLIVGDDQAVNKNTVAATQKLISVDEVDMIFYSETIQVQAAGPLAEEAQVPAVVFWESSPVIEDIGDYVFGFGLWQPSAGEMPAQFAREELGAETAAIIYDSNVWAETVVSYFKEEFESSGGKIILDEKVPNDLRDFRAVILKAQEAEADVLFAPISYHPGLFFKQLGELGYEGQVVSSDQIGQEFIDAAEGGLEGVYYSNIDDSVSPKLEELRLRYIDRYGEEPNHLHLIGLSYDALLAVADAWERTNETVTLQEALLATNGINGALGPFAVNDGGSMPREEIMYVVRDGRPAHVTP